MKNRNDRLETKAVHAGEPCPRINGAVAMPIFQTAMFEYAGESGYNNIRYIRLNNTPNHVALHAKLAALESGETALVTGSGMAAITTALLTVVGSGQHLLAQDQLYGGTNDFLVNDFAGFSRAFDFISGDDPGSWESKLRPTTKAIYVESITNPTMRVADLKAVVEFARAHNLISLIDNTFTSPVNFRPLDLGFDLALHSCTKYLNGHSDIVAGAVVGSADLIEKITHSLNHLGGTLDPHAAFLLHRGIKTLALRVRCQNENALRIAEFLKTHAAVEQVYYPGLPDNPGHARARELFAGFGGMLALELKGGIGAAEKFMAKLTIPIVAPSLGGVESLITLPATTSHAGLSASDRQRLGISDGLIRFSTGIEAVEDLLADFAQALAGL
ncbi:MAG: aminotransferase class I/II-fold pyridoxal phosphate-dependent enzyme [Verrucomicrobiota bacterium]|nr:aminotransferase class I/II-fold pyridoxal phosphate-dependent enzyme [Verrucomicrobiota bacterium]